MEVALQADVLLLSHGGGSLGGLLPISHGGGSGGGCLSIRKRSSNADNNAKMSK